MLVAFGYHFDNGIAYNANMKRTTTSGQLCQGFLKVALQKDSSLTMISKRLGKNKANVYRSLCRLKKKGVVFQHNKHWYLAKGERTTIGGEGTHKDNNYRTTGVLVRPHHAVICVAHRTERSLWERCFRGRLVKVWVPCEGVELSFQFTRVGVQWVARLPKSRDVLGDGISYHLHTARVVAWLERRFGCRFVRPCDLGVEKLYSELAYIRSSWAHSEVASGRRIVLYNWKDDGKPRFLFDKSCGAEFEEVGVTVDDDAVETAFFLEKLGSGELREAFGQAEALSAYMPELMGFMKVFADGMREHMDLIEGLKGVADSLRAVVKPSDSHDSGKVGVVDLLFADDGLRAWFEGQDRGVQDAFLGIRK